MGFDDELFTSFGFKNALVFKHEHLVKTHLNCTEKLNPKDMNAALFQLKEQRVCIYATVIVLQKSWLIHS